MNPLPAERKLRIPARMRTVAWSSVVSALFARLKERPPMRIRPATLADASAIASIYNEAVTGSTASFDTEPQTAEVRATWLTGRPARHAVVVAEDDGAVVGWGALSPYSDRCAYWTTAELSLYVTGSCHRKGVGRALAVELLESARREHLHTVLARICTENTASIALVASLGFTDAGTMHEVGFKFGRWLDVATLEYWVPEASGSRR